MRWSIQTIVQVGGRKSKGIFSFSFLEMKVDLILVENFPDLDIYTKSGRK